MSFDPNPNPYSALMYVGCAGWSLPRAEAEHFPETGSQLERYAAVFPAVEINSSFYRSHRPETYARWRTAVPETFRFSVKLPRTITHQLRLKKADELLAEFLSEVGALGDKLGCLLIQLPPSLRFDPLIAGQFFASLRARTNTALVCEPRHESWFGSDACALLEGLGIAIVYADPPVVARRLSQAREATVYVRLHGSPTIYRSAYSPAYLIELAQQLREHLDAGRRVWCIFDNTANGAAIPNALSLLEQFHAAYA